MKTTGIRVFQFRTHAEPWNIGHGRLRSNAEVHQTLACIDTDASLSGYFRVGGKHGDQGGLNVVASERLTTRIKALLVGREADGMVALPGGRRSGNDIVRDYISINPIAR